MSLTQNPIAPAPKASGRSELLFVKDIAHRLNRSVGQVNWMISSGQLPGTALIAGRRCMKEETLENWINSHFEEAEGDKLSA